MNPGGHCRNRPPMGRRHRRQRVGKVTRQGATVSQFVENLHPHPEMRDRIGFDVLGAGVRQLGPRQNPETPPARARRFLQPKLALLKNESPALGNLFDLGAGFLPGQQLRSAGAALAPDWTFMTPRVSRHADQGSKIHQGRIVKPATLSRKKPPGNAPQKCAARSTINGFLPIRQAREHPSDIGIDHRFRPVKREGPDRGSGVGAHSRQTAQGLQRGRNLPPVLREKSLGGPVEVPCPAIVSQSLPKREDIVFRRVAERFDGRKSRHPSAEIGNHRGNGRLLQHELRNHHPVGVASLPPRQVASASLKPPSQLAPDFFLCLQPRLRFTGLSSARESHYPLHYAADGGASRQTQALAAKGKLQVRGASVYALFRAER